MNKHAGSKPWTDVLHERLQEPAEAVAYLNAALEDPDYRVFLMAVRDVAAARGGLGRMANDTGLNRENLYRMLSENGNPRIDSLSILLADLGLRLAVDTLPPAPGSHQPRTKRPAR